MAAWNLNQAKPDLHIQDFKGDFVALIFCLHPKYAFAHNFFSFVALSLRDVEKGLANGPIAS